MGENLYLVPLKNYWHMLLCGILYSKKAVFQMFDFNFRHWYTISVYTGME